MIRKTIFLALPLLLLAVFSKAQQRAEAEKLTFSDFEQRWTPVGRGDAEVLDGEVLRLKDAFVSASGHEHENFEMRFKARAPKGEKEAMIWAGFAFADRQTRYAFALRGGNADDVYLCRYEPVGKDKMLALRPVAFHPVPGTWYDLRITHWNGKTAIFLGDEKQPLVKISEKEPLSPGGIILGGGYVTTEYRDVTVKALSASEMSALDNAETKPLPGLTASQKEAKRKKQRAKYRAKSIRVNTKGRTEISLDGNWLFMPEYDAPAKAQNPSEADNDWHVMEVPGFWTPKGNWMHMEKAGHMPDNHSGVSDNYRQKELERCGNYTFDYQKATGAWYRHWVNVPKNIGNKRVKLYFEAVSKIASVWVNGQKAGDHVGMFGDFGFNVTDLLKPGKNLIAVNVKAQWKKKDDGSGDEFVARAVSVDVTKDMLTSLPHGMFKNYEGGIWQPVSLVITDPVRVDDIFAKTRTDGADMDISILNSGESKNIEVSYEIRESGSKKLFFSSEKGQAVNIGAGETKTVTLSTPSLNPKLWTPETPNLYTLTVNVLSEGRKIDSKTITTGFRTFGTDGNRFMLNGHPYRLMGANHPPCGIAPTDEKLANKFFKMMHDGNQLATRSHGSPFTSVWMDAADRQGVGVSYEGTWPWLMIGSMPDGQLLEIWKEEMLALVRKYRNHPSLLVWTVNNEMYFTMFYHNDPMEVRLRKWKVLSDVIKEIRKLDPTRPISADSGYARVEDDYEKILKPNNIDDGDIDDRHIYFTWYNRDFYQIYNGDWAKRIYWTPGANADRPFFSQEASTGYPNNDTGHPTRKYIYKHYVPHAWVGDWAWEDKDPSYFLNRNAFMSKELCEVIRRTSPMNSGVLFFANVCWYRDVYDADKIEPYPVAESMKKALDPVLVSAELFGRNFWAGDAVNPDIYIVNDKADGSDLKPGKVFWQIVSGEETLASGEVSTGSVENYGIEKFSSQIRIPENMPKLKGTYQLKLDYKVDGKSVSQNEYNLTVAKKEWAELKDRKVALFDLTGDTRKAFDALGVPYRNLDDLTQMRFIAPDETLVVANLDAENEVPYNWEDVKRVASNGTEVLLIHPGKHLKWNHGNVVAGLYERTGRIVNMRIPESPIFDGIDPMELSWWRAEGRDIPIACRRSYTFKKKNGVTEFATYLRPHVYLGNPQEQLKDMSGSPLVEIKVGLGRVVASEMELNSADKDPVAAKLLVNLIKNLEPGVKYKPMPKEKAQAKK
ncbi:beta-galactosidase [Fulvitalea axinellae]|uniref:beta-galactosidase n=1 Tax=Fulvitalea axinellae TaxID=1182444 RepID=A0AAU9DIS7_9BACT|nr:beta-galactosidase [Fulvitalea axinellae]